MLEALIFDVDGTLAETEEAHRQAFNETFAAHGLDWHWTVSDYRDLLKVTGGKERMRHHRGRISATDPDDLTIAALHADKTWRYGDILARGLDLRPGVARMIDAAREAGLRVAVATTTNRPNVDALAKACFGRPADAVFDVIAAGDEVARKKPAPDVYRLALERLGLTPQSCIAFEDSRNGLLSAQGAGLRVIVTPSRFTDHEVFDGAIACVPDLESLPFAELSRSLTSGWAA
ncbi:MAG: HAD family hydrolase [Paracoccaceae bacterium]|nr:HAD family hydrolase [Paracoccaceae bacterium]